MIKNIIIAALALFSIFFFFYALTQQLKADNLQEIFTKAERDCLSQRETLEAALEDARRQTELVRLELKRSGQARQ